MAGYSQTPLAKKLGLKEGHIVRLVNQPKHYFKLFGDLPVSIRIIETEESHAYDFIHLFCKSYDELTDAAEALKKQLKYDGTLWVSWPKGSSSIPTDLKREIIRDHLLQVGLVDVKVCAVDENWSGLKFVYRLKDRK